MEKKTGWSIKWLKAILFWYIISKCLLRLFLFFIETHNYAIPILSILKTTKGLWTTFEVLPESRPKHCYMNFFNYLPLTYVECLTKFGELCICLPMATKNLTSFFKYYQVTSNRY